MRRWVSIGGYMGRCWTKRDCKDTRWFVVESGVGISVTGAKVNNPFAMRIRIIHVRTRFDPPTFIIVAHVWQFMLLSLIEDD